MKLLIATGNSGKFREMTQLLSGLDLEFFSLKDFPNLVVPEETGSSYRENARIKAETLAKAKGIWVLADDSGLEVEGLNWRPGLHSARWAGEGAGANDQIQKLLTELKNPSLSRRAVFRCVLALCSPEGELHYFAGELWGEITPAPRGAGGFGYDPVFFMVPLGKVLAELTLEEKNHLSHRALAMAELKRFLIPFLEKNH